MPVPPASPAASSPRVLVALLVPLALASIGATCGVGNTGKPCSVTTDCDDGAMCMNAFCVDDDTQPLVPGEGEGEGEPIGEGEGEVVIGGEGEGEPVGEGEGELVGEGEGEGEVVVPGEGEGEGEPVTTCFPSCGPLQECIDNTCQYTGELCDAFDPASTIGLFADVQASLDDNNARRYEVFGGDGIPSERFVRNFRIVGVPPPAKIAGVIVPTEIFVYVEGNGVDPALFAILDDQGQCQEVFRDDGPGGPAQSSFFFNAPVDLELMVTSTGPLDAGGFHISTRPRLCGKDTASLTAFDHCRRAFDMTPSFSCGNDPCARNEAGLLTGQACCVTQAGCHNIISLQNNAGCNP